MTEESYFRILLMIFLAVPFIFLCLSIYNYSIIKNNKKKDIETPKSVIIKANLFRNITIDIIIVYLCFIGFSEPLLIIIAIPMLFLVLSCKNFWIIRKNKKKNIETPKSTIIKAILFGILFMAIVTIYILFSLLLSRALANM